MHRSPEWHIDRLDDIQTTLFVNMLAWPLSMLVFGLGGSIVFGPTVGDTTAAVLLTLLIGCPIIGTTTTYAVLRRRTRNGFRR